MNCYSRMRSSRCGIKKAGKKRFLPLGRVVGVDRGSRYRFPGRLSAAALAAYGDRSCTGHLVANEASIDPETKIESCKALIGRRFR